MAAGGSSLTQAAASSIASGSPSRRAQIWATAGALFQLPIFPHTSLEELQNLDCEIMAADAGTSEGCVPIRAIRSIPARTVVAIGSESRGLSEPVLNAAKIRFTIPLKPNVESLNAAAAASIAIFQLSGLPVEGGKA